MKDSFTRMKQAQEQEHALRVAEHQKKTQMEMDRRSGLAVLRSELGNLFLELDPHKRGKKLEGVLNKLFKLNEISVREAFYLTGGWLRGC